MRVPWLPPFLADFAAIVAAYYSTLAMEFHSKWGRLFFDGAKYFFGEESGPVPPEFETFYIAQAPRILLFLTLAICLLCGLQNLYAGRRFMTRRLVGWKVFVANVGALAFFFAYFYLTRNRYHPRTIFASMLALNVVYCVVFRALMRRALSVYRTRFGRDQCHVLLVGSGSEAEYIYALVEALHPHGMLIAGRLPLDLDKPFAESVNDIETGARRSAADLLITAEQRLSVAQIMSLLELGDKLKIPVKVLSRELEVLTDTARIESDMIYGIPLIHFAAPRSPSVLRSRLRSAASAAIAGAAILALAPLFLFVAALIKLTSKGPVFFVQERIGVNQRSFRMYKFRTMYERAEEEQRQLEELNEAGESLFKIKKDPRVTPAGQLLRRISIDELPQLLNVVRGEMAFVGPRPLPRRDFERYYEQWHYSRHNDMPGITCLWQVSGRSLLAFESMCLMDVYYLRNQSWLLNLKIMLKTLWSIIFARGAY